MALAPPVFFFFGLFVSRNISQIILDYGKKHDKVAEMYGKVFEQMFEGSMYGKGSLVFAVWSYVIAHQKPNHAAGYFTVELNPMKLKDCIGEPLDEIKQTLEFLCSPDPNSRTKDEDGRRLVRLGEFDYRVVNGKKYHDIRKQEERREQNRVSQEKFRKKQKREKDTGMDGRPPSMGYRAREARAVKAQESGNQQQADEIAAEGTTPIDKL